MEVMNPLKEGGKFIGIEVFDKLLLRIMHSFQSRKKLFIRDEEDHLRTSTKAFMNH